nr:hypothetical protein [Tanacetum cinerariifolium]
QVARELEEQQEKKDRRMNESTKKANDQEAEERILYGYDQKQLRVEDEPASPMRDVSEGKACPTDSGFIANQDRATIAKSSTLPHDSAPRVTSPAADEGSAQEEEIVSLKERVKVLEDKEDVAVTQSGDDAPIKERSINEGEAAAERIINNSEEIARVLTSIDAATVEDFIPIGSKEETERLKRKGLNLEKEQVKKQKSSKEAPEIETSTEEITKEKMKEMMQLVPVEDVYVQALQVKHPIIDWKVHTEGQRSY